ncbi:MAG: hypothetical protein WC632_02525 [Candidatus Margulisiibacteriota bacterium]
MSNSCVINNQSFSYDPAKCRELGGVSFNGDAGINGDTGTYLPSANPANIPVPPPLSISQSSDVLTFSLTYDEFSQLDKRKIAFTPISARYFEDPANKITADSVGKKFNLSPEKIEKVDSLNKRSITVTISQDTLAQLTFAGFKLAPLEEPKVPSERRAALNAAGITDPDNLPGTIYLRFSYEENSNRVKDYFIYWLSRNSDGTTSTALLAKRVKGEETLTRLDQLPEGAKAYVRSLQRLLQLKGILPEKKNLDLFDLQSLQLTYSYLANNRELLRPSLPEQKDILKSLQNSYLKKHQTYRAILADKKLDKEVKTRLLRELAMELLEVSNQIYQQAKQMNELFPNGTITNLRTNQEQPINEFLTRILNYIPFMLDSVLGKSGDKEKSFFESTYIVPAERKLENYLKGKKANNKEKEEELRGDLQELRQDYIRLYTQLYEYESARMFATVPGVASRSREIRADIIKRLDRLVAAYPAQSSDVQDLKTELTKIDQRETARLPHETERLNILYESAHRFGSDKDKNLQLPDTALLVRYHYEKANHLLTRVLEDSPLRPLMIALVNDITTRTDTPLGQILEQFGRLVHDLKENDLNALGEYFFMRNHYSSLGYAETEIESKTAALKGRAQVAIKKIEDICKRPKDRSLQNKLTNSLQNFVSHFYNLQRSYNIYAANNNKSTINFTAANDLMQKINQALPPTNKDSKEVFSILAELPEDYELAKVELSKKAAKENTKAIEADPSNLSGVNASQFDRRAQEVMLTPRMLGFLADQVGSSIGQKFTAADLKIKYPEQDKKTPFEASGVYLVSHDPATNDPIFTRVNVEPPALEERNFSGTAIRRDLPDLVDHDGAALFNIATAGRSHAAGTLSLTSSQDRCAVDGVTDETITGLLDFASQGDAYELQGGLEFTSYEQPVLTSVAKYQGDNGLTAPEQALLIRLTEPEARFKPEEAARLRQLAARITSIAPTNLTVPEDKAAFASLAGTIQRRVTNYLERKPGLTGPEQATLTQMREYIKQHKFVIQGRTFEHGPTDEILALIPAGERADFTACWQKTMTIFKRLMFQLQKMSVQSMPENDVPDVDSAWYAYLWQLGKSFGYGTADGFHELTSPQKIQNMQQTGLPPAMTMGVKMQMYQDRYSRWTANAAFYSRLEILSDPNVKETPAFTSPEMDQLRAYFKVTDDQQLTSVFAEIKATAKIANDFAASLANLQEQKNRLTALLEGRPINRQDLDAIKPGLFDTLKAAGYLNADGKVQSKFVDSINVNLALTDTEKKQTVSLLTQYQGLETRLHNIQARLKDLKPADDASDDNLAALKGVGDAGEKDYKEVARKLTALTQIRDKISELVRLSESYAKDPIQVVARVDRIKQQIADLAGSDNLRKLNANNTFENDLLSGLRTGLSVAETQAEKLTGARTKYMFYLELKQKTQISVSTEGTFFSGDRFDINDYEALQGSGFSRLLDDRSFIGEITASLFSQQDSKIFGYHGRDTFKTPRQLLNAFFFGTVDRTMVSPAGWNALVKLGLIDEQGILVSRFNVERQYFTLNEVSEADAGQAYSAMAAASHQGQEGFRLATTNTEFGETNERTLAKLAITKVFERIPQPGQANFLMPLLLYSFGKHHNLHGVASLPRELTTALGGVTGLGDHAYGPETTAEQIELLNSTAGQVYYNFVSSLAMESSQMSPYAHLADQLHFYMIYNSPNSSNYLRSLVQPGGDIRTQLRLINRSQVADFGQEVQTMIDTIRRNPLLLKDLNLLMGGQSGQIKSALMRRVIKDANLDHALMGTVDPAGVTAIFDNDNSWKHFFENPDSPNHGRIKFKLDFLQLIQIAQLDETKRAQLRTLFGKSFVLPPRDYKEQIDRLWPAGRTEPFSNFTDPTNAPAELVALSQVFEDLTKLSPTVNRSRNTDDPKRRALSSLSLSERLIEWGALKETGGKTPKNMCVLENVEYNPNGGTINRPTVNFASRYYRDTKTWLGETYGPQFVQDVYQTFTDKEAAIRVLTQFRNHLLTQAVNYGWKMPRSIATGLSAIIGGLIEAYKTDSPTERAQILAKVFEQAGSTGASFSGYEVFSEIFWGSLKDHAEQGNIGALAAEAILIPVMFSATGFTSKTILAWGKNQKVRLWDRAIKNRMTPLERGYAMRNLSHILEGTGVKILTALPRYGLVEPVRRGIRAAKAGGTGPIDPRRPLQIEIGRSIEIGVGNDSGAHVTSTAWNRANYYGRGVWWGNDAVTGGISHGYHAAGDLVTSLPGFLGRSALTAVTKLDDKAKVKDLSAAGEMIDRLRNIRSNPDGFTPINITRERPEFAKERSLLEQKIKAGQPLTGQEQARLQQLTSAVKKGKVYVKNSDLWRWIENSKVDGLANLRGKFPAGSRQEWNTEIGQMRKFVEQNRAAIDVPVDNGNVTNGVKLLTDLAQNPDALTREYSFPVEEAEGKIVIRKLRGDQVARLVATAGQNKPTPFVEEFGLTEPAAAQIVGQIQGEFQAVGQPARMVKLAESANRMTFQNPIEAEFRKMGLSHAKINDGAFLDVAPEDIEAFKEAARKAKDNGLTSIEIESGVRFGGEGRPALLELIKTLNNNPLKKINVAQKRNGYFLNETTPLSQPSVVDAAEIADQVKAARRDLELARDKALARIDAQNITADRKAQMKTEALHTWEREMFGLEKAIVEKRALEAEIKTEQAAARQLYGEITTLRKQLKTVDKNPAETARLKSLIGAKTAQLEGIRQPLGIKVRAFTRAHGPMIALILGLDIAMNWHEIKTGGAGQAAATGAAALGGYLAFAAGEEAFVNLFKVGKGAAGPLTGAALGVTVATLRHKETLMGGDRSAKAAALADIVKEGVAGYLAVKAGALAAAPLAENPLLAGAVGLGVGALVYGGIEWGGEALGYKQWIDRTVTKGHLVDSFKEKDKFGISLKVNNNSANLPYFNEQNETVTVDGQAVKISKAQQFLGVIQAAVNFNKMRPAERAEFIRQNGEFGRLLGRYMRTINQINQLEVNGYADLTDETLDRANSAIEQYREEHGLRDSDDGNIKHRFDIKVNRRFTPVNDPITGQTVGQQVLYDIEVTGARVSRGFGQAGIDQLYETKTYSGNGVEGNLDRLLQSSIILQTADPEAPNQYNIGLNELAAHNIALPLTQLDRFPVARQELASRLSHLGYRVTDDQDQMTAGSLMAAYLEFTNDQGNPTTPTTIALPGGAQPVGPEPVFINLSGYQLDPALINAARSQVKPQALSLKTNPFVTADRRSVASPKLEPTVLRNLLGEDLPITADLNVAG